MIILKWIINNRLGLRGIDLFRSGWGQMACFFFVSIFMDLRVPLNVWSLLAQEQLTLED
jgi:hypothetical protein